MERRTSERQFTVTNVMVTYTNLGLVQAKSRDLSLGGMCIDTGSISLPVNAPVSVSFTVNSPEGQIDCEAHALVVRSDSTECCLMFDGMSEDAHQALKALVGDWQFVPGSSTREHAVSA